MRIIAILSLAFAVIYPGAAQALDNAPRIIVYSLGPVSTEWVAFAEDIIHAAYGYYTDLRGDAALLEDYGPSETGAYYAREILNDMDVIAAVESTRVIVLTELKLTRKENADTTCAGLSHSARGTAVISTSNAAKDDADETIALSRITKRLLHETGHASGLHHCKQPLCFMTFFADTVGSDAAHFVLCPRCSGLLEENTRINYEIARECLITSLIIQGMLNDSRDERTTIPPPPDDLRYDLSGTEKLGVGGEGNGE
ncbi:MAG: hypothetical protein GY771_00825 [bacterium]|nr:hypothetical protein [bacterium]